MTAKSSLAMDTAMSGRGPVRKRTKVVAGAAGLIVAGSLVGVGATSESGSGVLDGLRGLTGASEVTTGLGEVGGTAAPATAIESGTPAGVVVDPATGMVQPTGVSTAGEDGEVRLNVGEIAPSTTTSALFVPYSVADSWAAVSRLMNSRTQLATINLADSPVTDRIAVVGAVSVPSDGKRYSYDGGDSSNDISPTTEFVYIATSDAAAAEELRAWLVTSDLYGGLSVETRGSLVVIAPSWIRPSSALDGDRLGGVEAFTTATASITSPSLLYVDVAANLGSNAQSTTDDLRTKFQDYVALAVGATDTYWVASVGESAYDWNGSYVGDPIEKFDEEGSGAVLAGLYSTYFTPPDPNAMVSEIISSEIPPEVSAAVRGMGAITSVEQSGSLVTNIDESTLDGAFASLAASANIERWTVTAQEDGALSVVLTPADEVWSSAALVTN